MRKILTITSSLLFAAILILPGASQAQNRQGGTIKPQAKISLPCSVQATKLSGNTFSVKLVATNDSGAWLQQGKKIYFTFGPGSTQSLALGVMVPDTGIFTLKTFNYTANPYTPQSQGCAAFYYR